MRSIDPWGENPDPMCFVEHMAEQVTEAAKDIGLEDRMEFFIRFHASKRVLDFLAQIKRQAPAEFFERVIS